MNWLLIKWRLRNRYDRLMMKLFERTLCRLNYLIIQRYYLEGIRKGWKMHDQYIKAMLEQLVISLSQNPVMREFEEIINRKGFQ